MPKNHTRDLLTADLLNATQRHVVGVLHRPMRVGPPIPNSRIPDISSRYHLTDAHIGGQPCILLLPNETTTPDTLASDVNRVERHFKTLAIVVQATMTSANRSRLVQRGVPFIVPGSHLYVPPLALDLREIYRQPVTIYKGGLPPVSQAVLFYVALAGGGETTPSQIASALEYTPMSVGRALDELAAHGVGQVERRGREKIFHLPERHAAIKDAGDLLRAPARGVHGVRFGKRRPKMLQAGETALAALTGMEIDALPTFAIPSLNWRAFFEEHDIEDLWDIGGAEAVIETWRYDPSILSKGPYVDPLSLYAQYRKSPDARLADAAEKLLTKVLG